MRPSEQYVRCVRPVRRQHAACIVWLVTRMVTACLCRLTAMNRGGPCCWQAAARLCLTVLSLEQVYSAHARVSLAMVPAGIQVWSVVVLWSGNRTAVCSEPSPHSSSFERSLIVPHKSRSSLAIPTGPLRSVLSLWHAVQDLRLTNVSLESGPDDGHLRSADSGRRRGSPGALAHLQSLALLASVRNKTDLLQQLALLAPQTAQLTALTLSGWGVLDRARTADLVASLRFLPALRVLEARLCAQLCEHWTVW